MTRSADASGVSGIGKVAEGIEFSNGFIVAHWLSKDESINIYKDLISFVNVHIKSHPDNGTILHWDDGEIQEFKFKEEITVPLTD